MKMFIKNRQICKGETSLLAQVFELIPQSLQVNLIEFGYNGNLVYQGCLMVTSYVVKPTGPIDQKHDRYEQNSR
jgi:hypothetical protein